MLFGVDGAAEYMQMYICNCISTCGAIKDKYIQHRHVRLVSTFLLKLIHKKAFNVAVCACQQRCCAEPAAQSAQYPRTLLALVSFACWCATGALHGAAGLLY